MKKYAVFKKPLRAREVSAGVLLSHFRGGAVAFFEGENAPTKSQMEALFLSADAPPVVLTPLAFIERFTDAEKLAVFSSEDPGVILFRNLAIAAREIRSDDERTQDGLAYLVHVGILAESRLADVLA